MTCHSLRSLEMQLGAIIAQCEAMRATVRAAIESTATAPTADAITLESATALLGSKRRARETFAAFEREGFAVSRVGHAVFMARAEWDRAIAAQGSKRPASTSSPTVPASAPVLVAHNNDDDSPAALLSRAGLSPTRSHNPNPRTPKRRAA